MRIAVPLALAAMVLVLPALAWLLARGEREWRRDVAKYGDPALLRRSTRLPSIARRRAARVLVLLAAAALLAALARPQLGTASRIERRSGRDVMIVLDLSRSMLAQDVAPSRLVAARAAAIVLDDSLRDDRLGLVVFGGSAFLQLPPTLDRGAFTLFAERATPRDIFDPSTSLEGAAATTAAAFAHAGSVAPRVAIVLSDGEDGEGKLSRAIDVLRSARVRTFTVGFGTAAGAAIPDRVVEGGAAVARAGVGAVAAGTGAGGAEDTTAAPAMAVHRDWAGRVVITHLVARNLADVATATGGAYVRWSGPESVRPIIERVEALERHAVRSRVRSPRAERFRWPLAVALLALVAELLVRTGGGSLGGRDSLGTGGDPRGTRVRRMPGRAASAVHRVGQIVRLRWIRGPVAGAALVVAAVVVLGAQVVGRRPEILYAGGHFRRAYDALRAMAGRGAGAGRVPPAVVEYDMGDALFRLTRYDEAVAHFRAALAGGGAPRLRERATYNLGTTYLQMADTAVDRVGVLEAAIGDFEDALILDPGDRDAKWNLEFAYRALDDARTRFGRGRPQHGADWGSGNVTKSGDAGRPQVGAGAAPGAGFGTGRGGRAASRITETRARQMLQAIERAQIMAAPPMSHGGAARPVGRYKDW